MKIIEALKNENVRLSIAGRWLVSDGEEWIVYETARRLPKCIYRGSDEGEAVRILLGDE